MQVLESAQAFFQKLFGNISLNTIDHRWLIIGFAVLVIVLLVVTQDKPKAITFLILIYTISFVAFLIPSFVKAYDKAVPSSDRFVINIVFGAMPVVALLVHKYKRGKKH